MFFSVLFNSLFLTIQKSIILQFNAYFMNIVSDNDVPLDIAILSEEDRNIETAFAKSRYLLRLWCCHKSTDMTISEVRLHQFIIEIDSTEKYKLYVMRIHRNQHKTYLNIHFFLSIVSMI